MCSIYHKNNDYRSFVTNLTFYLLLSALSAGCSANYNRQMALVKKEVETSNYNRAIAVLSKSKIKDNRNNSLLYHLETGLLYHLLADYETSNRFLESAEWISDELYTKSLSRQASSLLTSDKILPYRGEFFEHIFTNYYKILNYLYLDNLEDALVEVRRINHKLSVFNITDAFMHYLTAILYQHNMQDSDAFIEYKKAYDTYKKIYPGRYSIDYPEQLSNDISVFCRESRFPRCDEFPANIRNSYTPPSEYGSAVFILETGFISEKTEVIIQAAIPQEYRKKHPHEFKDTYYLAVALPAFSKSADTVLNAQLHINNTSLDMYLVEDLGIIAETVLKDQQPGILAKAIARAVSKYLAYRSVKGNKSSDENKNLIKSILSTSVNILGMATEGADTRSWLMLPDRIFMSRRYLKPGEYRFRITSTTEKGQKTTVSDEKLTISKGETKFIVLRQF